MEWVYYFLLRTGRKSIPNRNYVSQIASDEKQVNLVETVATFSASCLYEKKNHSVQTICVIHGFFTQKIITKKWVQ